MNKLSKKFITGIVIILGLACLCTIIFNTSVLERYYLYQKKTAIIAVSDKFKSELAKGVPPKEAMEQLEEADKVIIVSIENAGENNIDKINEDIREAFQEKGIGFQKYWFWEEDYERILDGENKIRLYRQSNLNYSLFIDYMQVNQQLFAITMIIPDISDAFGIINQCLIFINVTTIVIAILFISIFTKKITKPLYAFDCFAEHMRNNEFIPLNIDSKDEFMCVANSLNKMGQQIIMYQQCLQEKNKEMEQLLDDVAHELKTPISLIELYSSGIKDGLDDGTFLDTILLENRQMADMVEQLLYASRIEKKNLEREQLNLTLLLENLIEEYTVLAQKHDMQIFSHLQSPIFLHSSTELLSSLIRNLLSNAIAHGSGSEIEVNLQQEKEEIRLSVSNETKSEALDLVKIWLPYYVGEQSRNKNLSGTGLGLTIVKKICEKLQYSIECTRKDGKITFTLTIPISDGE